jgi:putative redox protein
VISATARRQNVHHHEVEVDGHIVVVDEPTEAGGTDVGPSPTRLLAASLASCTAITIGMYADRKEWDIEGLEVTVDFEGTPASGEPARFVVHLSLPSGLSEEQVERLEVVSGKCPVHRLLTGEVEIETRTKVAGA